MEAIVEISLYPLTHNFIPAIDDFISRLHLNKSVRISTNELSTQIKGDYSVVMDLMKNEMMKTFLEENSAVFVLKVHCPK